MILGLRLLGIFFAVAGTISTFIEADYIWTYNDSVLLSDVPPIPEIQIAYPILGGIVLCILCFCTARLIEYFQRTADATEKIYEYISGTEKKEEKAG
jgi:hypothetical protein